MHYFSYKTVVVGVVILSALLPVSFDIVPRTAGIATEVRVSIAEAKSKKSSTKQKITVIKNGKGKYQAMVNLGGGRFGILKLNNVKKIDDGRWSLKVGGQTVYVRRNGSELGGMEKAVRQLVNGLPATSCRNVTTNLNDWGRTITPPVVCVGAICTPPPYIPPVVPPGDGSRDNWNVSNLIRTRLTMVPTTFGYYEPDGTFVPVDPVAIDDFRIDAVLTNNKCTLYWNSSNATACTLRRGETESFPVDTESPVDGFRVTPGTYRLYCEHGLTGSFTLTDPVTCRANIDFREI